MRDALVFSLPHVAPVGLQGERAFYVGRLTPEDHRSVCSQRNLHLSLNKNRGVTISWTPHGGAHRAWEHAKAFCATRGT